MGITFSFERIALVVLAGVLTWSVGHHNARYERVSRELEASQAELARLKAAQKNMSAPAARAQEAKEDTQSPTDPSAPTKSKAPERTDSATTSAVDWKASFYISEIERFVAISDEQRTALQSALATRFRDSSSPAVDVYQRVLQEELGEELAARYQNALEEADAKREQDELVEQTIVWSRKLALDTAQENQVGSVLRDIAIELRPLELQMNTAMREAMSRHSGDQSDKVALRESYDQLKMLERQRRSMKDAALQERLRGVLSESQYNQLLAELAQRER